MAESAERFLWAYTWSDVLDGRPWDATFTNTHLAVEGEPLTLAWAGAAGPVSIDVVSAANVPSVSRGLVIGSRQDGLGWRWRQLRSLDAVAPGAMFDSNPRSPHPRDGQRGRTGNTTGSGPVRR